MTGNEARGLAGIMALEVVREAAGSLGLCAGDQAGRVRQVTALLVGRRDLDRLDDWAAVVARGGAKLAPSHVAAGCLGGGIAVPLGPILAELRDRAFA